MGERNGDYWARRFQQMEEALQDRSYGYVENLEAQFATAQGELDKQIARWYQRFSDNNGITLADAKRLLTRGELKELHWTVEQYIAYGRQNALDGGWMKQLENASARVHISRLEALKLQLQQQAEVLYSNQLDFVDRAARQIYEGSYYHTAFELQRGLGVGRSMQALNQGAITKVLSRPWTADNRTFRDKCWVNKQSLVNTVNTQLTQMIIRGEAPDRAIAAVAKQFEVSKAKAGRLIMTESAYFASAAQQDCFKALEVEHYKIVASFDRDTCGLCGSMDGRVFEMAEYQAGLTAPPFHPWCRCCTCPSFEDMEGIGERWARDPEGSARKLPADISFEKWKKSFVMPVAKAGETGIMKELELFNHPITQESLDKVGLVETQAFPGKMAVELQRRHRELLEFIQKEPAGTEAIAYYDMQLNLLTRYAGEANRVQGSRVTVPHITMHNHPSCTTFTHQDIKVFLNNDAKKILSAVGNDGHVFLVEKADGFDVKNVSEALKEMTSLLSEVSSVEEYLASMEKFLTGSEKYGIKYSK